MSIKVLFVGAVLTLFVSNVFAQSAAVKSACNGAVKEIDRCAVMTGQTADKAKEYIKEMIAVEGVDDYAILICNNIKEKLIESNCGKNEEEYKIQNPREIF